MGWLGILLGVYGDVLNFSVSYGFCKIIWKVFVKGFKKGCMKGKGGFENV